MRSTRKRCVVGAVFAVALAVNLAVGIGQGLERPMQSDAYYYLQLAQSLADGQGYVVRDGFWPTAPSLQRMPGWPALVAVALRVLPELPADGVMRTLNLSINAGCAALVYCLALALWPRRGVALLAAGLYVVHPLALACADEGLSEPLFMLLGLAGTLLLQRGLAAFTADASGNRRRNLLVLAGFGTLGLASLVRANFAMWIMCFGACVAVWSLGSGLWRRPSWWAILLAGALLFVVPPTLWAWRNARICGAFPVLSTIRGQTYYGGNNTVVAESMEYWGYWIFPDVIPGETPLVELSRTMSEYEVDAYYYAKGQAFVSSNLPAMPRLLLGKLIRAYVPVPWHPTPGAYAVCVYRFVLEAAALLGLLVAWRATPVSYRAILVAMVLTNGMTVLVFYGYNRFGLVVEPFLLPFTGVGIAAMLRSMRRRIQPEAVRNGNASLAPGVP